MPEPILREPIAMELPLFPLSGIVMPDGLMPLRLFERRYIDMVTGCLRAGSGFGVCLIREGREAGQPAEPYPLGTEVQIVDFDQGADGLLHITAKGVREFAVLHHAANDSQLLIGEVEVRESAGPTSMEPAFESLAGKLDLILRYVEPDFSYPEKHLDDADWVCHRLLELLPLTAPAKFELLQMDSNRERLETLASLQIEIADRAD